MNGFSVAVTCLAGITFYVGTSHLLYYFRTREKREILAFSFTCFAIFFYNICCAGLYSVDLATAGAYWQRWQFVSLTLLSIFLLWFVLEFTGRKPGKMDIALFCYFVFEFFAIIFFSGGTVITNETSIKHVVVAGHPLITYYEMKTGVLLAIHSVVGLVLGYYILYVLYRYYKKDAQSAARTKPILLGVIVLLLGVVNDSAVGIGLYKFIYVIEYSYMCVMLGMAYSLTSSHVKAQVDLRLSQGELMRLAAAVNGAAESIMVTDVDGMIQYVNPCFERMTGYTSGEVIGKTPKILRSGKQDDEFYGSIWNTIKSGKEWQGHFTNRRKDGTLYEEDATIAPVRDIGGQIVNFVAVKRDVTQERELEQQLQQSQKMEAIGKLAGKVAHDFTNLLVAIFGHSQILKNKLPKGAGEHAHVDEIITAANRASSITGELLAFAHNQPLALTELDLNKTVHGVEAMIMETTGKEYNIEVVTDKREMKVRADRSHIEQVVVQMVVNAREAMGDMGRLTIETSHVHLSSLELAQLESGLKHDERDKGDYAVLQVSDDGSGMDEETRTHVFEPFYTTKAGKVSSGLGLSTTYRMIEQHDGYMTVYSYPGVGTTFTAYLPMLKVDAGEEIKEKPVVVAGNGRTVLVVMSDRLSRRILTKILLEVGFAVLEAETCKEGLALAQKHGDAIKLAMCDVVDGMKASEMAEALKKVVPEVKIVFVSGFPKRHLERLGLVPEGYCSMNAPFSKQQLVDNKCLV